MAAEGGPDSRGSIAVAVEATSRLQDLAQRVGSSLVENTLLKVAVGAVGPEIVVPAALLIGALQITNSYPLPPELGKQARDGDIVGAAKCLGEYVYANAHHLLDRENAAGKVLKGVSRPFDIFLRVATANNAGS